MAVYTDSPRFASAFLPSEGADGFLPLGAADPPLAPLLGETFGSLESVSFSGTTLSGWPHLLLTEFAARSQFDLLIDLARSSDGLPNGVVSMAGAGQGFHGFKGRPWAAVPGNIHLAIHLAPHRAIDRFEVAFTAMAALSVVDSLAQIAGLEEKPTIKWVNDVLLGDAKVAGVLAYTQSQGDTVTSAVLGIGLNADARPEVEATPFVPRVSSIREWLPKDRSPIRAEVFLTLLEALKKNYRALLQDGADTILDRYRASSMVVGRDVTICTEHSDRTLQVVARGRVVTLGENLELILDGQSKPITGGRLIMGPMRRTTETG